MILLFRFKLFDYNNYFIHNLMSLKPFYFRKASKRTKTGNFCHIMTSTINWIRRPVKGVLLDITGVIYNTTTDSVLPIPGSIEAIQKLV